MSEGAASATPAPTNGASGGQAPAAPAPTPKNGEGAVVSEPPKFQPIKRRLKFGDGSEEEYEVDSEEALDRMRLGQKLADKASKEAKALRQKEAERKERLAKKDYAPLKDLGFDPDAYFVERLQDELRREQMPETERQREAHESRLKQAEARALAAEQKAQQLEQAQAEEREWATLQPRLGKAMREAGMLDDTHAWQSISEVAQEFLANGIDAPPEVLIKEAAARDDKRFGERLGKLTPATAQAVWTKMPPDVRKAFGYLAAQEHIKAKTNIPAPSEPVPPQQGEAPRKEEPVSVGEREWLRKLR